MPYRITSTSKNYRLGDLSVFPKAIDSEATLFRAANNVETKIRSHVSMASKYIIVDDAKSFPGIGLLKIANPKGGNAEIIFYGRKIGNQFHWLQRAYGGTAQANWPVGSIVSCPVMAEHHNALKDAIFRIQRKVGLLNKPDSDSLHGTIRSLEQRWLTPKALFRAYPRTGKLSSSIRFQNFSIGHGLRYLWDFGDSTTSAEKNPTHTYEQEGSFTVKLNIISANGAHSLTEKTDYIKISNEERKVFFYSTPTTGNSNTESLVNSTIFELIDQTDGDIVERHWFFGDGADKAINNSNIHTVKHKYQNPGTYSPNLLVKFSDGQMARAVILEPITVF